MNPAAATAGSRVVSIGPMGLEGIVSASEDSCGLIIFAHGSGSSRFSPRNNAVAQGLRDAGLGTLLFDLLTPHEAADRRNVFDISLLGKRVVDAVEWALRDGQTQSLPIGLFGASTGAAAALVAAARMPDAIGAVVSRGGRPDLAAAHLPKVRAPTLLIVGGADDIVIELNKEALRTLECEKQLLIVPGATHLFEEPGTLEEVVKQAADWFCSHLVGPTQTKP